MGILRILIVDDSTLMRKIIREALAPLPMVEIVGAVSNGKDALNRAASLKPDVITLDVEMPGMNGIEVLEGLKNVAFGGAVVMLSYHTAAGAPMTIKALELGAFDFILKPALSSIEANIEALQKMFLPISQALRQRKNIKFLLQGGQPRGKEDLLTDVLPESSDSAIRSKSLPATVQIVAIGVSTGGPKALIEIIPKLPGDLHVPVVVVQHMPEGFTEEFAKSLDAKSRVRVKEAEDGEKLEPGVVYVAQGGRHMKIGQSFAHKIVTITDEQPENSCRPSVDYCFRSVAKFYGGNSLAVILTGMGKDGTVGAQLMRREGARVIAQDEESSVVFGMPKAVIDAGAADIVSPLHEIANEICRNLRR